MSEIAENETYGDRLTGAKLIIDALSESKIDAEQAERLLDALIPVQNAILPQRPDNVLLPSIQLEPLPEDLRDPPMTRDERQEAIDAELERIAAEAPAVEPGTNLLEDPNTFVAKVANAKLHRLQAGTKHR